MDKKELAILLSLCSTMFENNRDINFLDRTTKDRIIDLFEKEIGCDDENGFFELIKWIIIEYADKIKEE